MADLDGDGKNDLITGTYEGLVYWLRGGATGFAKPEQLQNADGAPLRAGMFWETPAKRWQHMKDPHGISAFPVDWDADGDFDLVLGTTGGEILVTINEGTPKAPRFAAAMTKLTVDGGKYELKVSTGHSMPVAVDWDGDGLFDIVTGSADGAVWWYRNVGKKGAPSFADRAALVPPSSDAFDAPGIRTQVAVADFDGDGRVDLLVGDYAARAGIDGGKREVRGNVWLFRRAAAQPAPKAADEATRSGDARDEDRR